MLTGSERVSLSINIFFSIYFRLDEHPGALGKQAKTQTAPDRVLESVLPWTSRQLRPSTRGVPKAWGW